MDTWLLSGFFGGNGGGAPLLSVFGALSGNFGGESLISFCPDCERLPWRAAKGTFRFDDGESRWNKESVSLSM
jgi:hypothetical protein